jgi:hypothetical protein
MFCTSLSRNAALSACAAIVRFRGEARKDFGHDMASIKLNSKLDNKKFQANIFVKITLINSFLVGVF